MNKDQVQNGSNQVVIAFAVSAMPDACAAWLHSLAPEQRIAHNYGVDYGVDRNRAHDFVACLERLHSGWLSWFGAEIVAVAAALLNLIRVPL